MKDNEQEFEWSELKDIWNNSPHTKKINIQLSELMDEVKSKTSQFEKDSIAKDLSILSVHWEQYKGMISQFEKDAVKNDLITIKKFLKRFFELFKKKS